jgi:predicted DNA-binding transcriptional regulator AlpA
MRFLDEGDLRQRGIKMSRQQRYRLIRKRRFPAPVKLGTGPGAHNVWVDDEIDAYMQACVAERDERLTKDAANPNDSQREVVEAAVASVSDFRGSR